MTDAKIRVLIDGTPLLGQRTGIGRYVASLIDELDLMSDVDARVMGFTLRGWRRLRSEAAESTRIVGPPVSARMLRALWSRGTFPPVELLGGNADIIHGTNFSLPPSVRAGGVVTVHDLAFLDEPDTLPDPELPAVVRRSVQRADIVCTPTHAVAKVVQDRLDVAESRVVPTPLGVDSSWFDAVAPDSPLRAKYGLPPEYLIFVGSDLPRKGLAGLLKAYPRDLPPLVIAGPDGPCDDERIIRTGYLPEEDLRRIVAGAEALILPSRDEGFGLPALEALACGVPVVCSDIPALREVTDGHALLFPHGDTAALRNALAEALDQPRHKQANALRKAHAAQFTWRRCAETTVNAYRRAHPG